MDIFNIKKTIFTVTLGQPRKMLPTILWTLFEFFLKGVPYGILLLIVWEIFAFLESDTTFNMTHIIFYCTCLFINLILLYFVSKKSYYYTFVDGYRLSAESRLKLIKHLKVLPMGYYNANDPGTVGEYVVGDFDNVEQLTTHLIPQIIGSLFLPLFSIIVLGFFSLKMALLAFMVIPIAFIFLFITRSILEKLGKRHLKAVRNVTSRILEYVQGIKLVKAFNLQGKSFKRLDDAFLNLKRKSIQNEAGVGPAVIFASFILQAGITIIIIFGFTFMLAKTLPLSVYIMFLIVTPRIYEPLIQVLFLLSLSKYMELSLERIEELKKIPEQSEGNITTLPDNLNIEFKNVDFSYRDRSVLKNINFAIPENSLTALVGPSGSGKTTLTRLIARFWDINKGEILLGGENIGNYNLETFMSTISIVFQDVYLFNDTIYNNIRIGKPDATKEEIENAAKTARCFDFIEKLPAKFQSMVGEAGANLSGGERQRISIARAILKDAPIVMLDEATASLDPDNELYIQDAINKLVNNKTLIIIAHRLNTIKNADKIIVLEDGNLVGQGKHDELLQSCKTYKTMWDEQSKAKNWKFVG